MPHFRAQRWTEYEKILGEAFTAEEQINKSIMNQLSKCIKITPVHKSNATMNSNTEKLNEEILTASANANNYTSLEKLMLTTIAPKKPTLSEVDTLKYFIFV